MTLKLIDTLIIIILIFYIFKGFKLGITKTNNFLITTILTFNFFIKKNIIYLFIKDIYISHSLYNIIYTNIYIFITIFLLILFTIYFIRFLLKLLGLSFLDKIIGIIYGIVKLYFICLLCLLIFKYFYPPIINDSIILNFINKNIF